jgi:HEAT repeat protein
VKVCIDFLGRPNVKGDYLDAVCWDLREHACENIDDLVAAFRAQTDRRVRSLVMAAIAESRSQKAFSLFIEILTGPDEELRPWAVRGLYQLNTREAKRILWQAEAQGFADL